MTLGAFAALLNVAPRWVQNAALRLGHPLRYTEREAQRLALARELHEAAGMPLPKAYDLAIEALAQRQQQPTLTIVSPSGNVQLHINVDRFLARFAVARARVRTMYAPKQRGRPALAVLPAEFGVDLGSIRENVRRSPTERLESLQAACDFFDAVHRVP